MFVRTERLFLRPGWPEDVEDLMGALRKKTTQRARTTPALAHDREAARKCLEQTRDPRFPYFFIYLRGASGARLVGGIGLGMQGDNVDVSYWIAEDHRGNGYAREALCAVVDQARVLGHRRLVVQHPPGNDASIRVLEAAGFREALPGDGVLRDDTAGGRVFIADLTVRRASRPYANSPSAAAEQLNA